MLFDNYEKITYNIGGKDLTLADIFKSISFKDVETSSAFYDYYIQDGETPEIVSARLYQTTAYSWLILLVNNIADIKNEWFESAEEFERNRERDYGGYAYYVSTLPDLQPGDVMVKVTGISGAGATGITASVYQHIADFDTNLRKIRGICGSANFISGDNVLFARKQDNGNVTPLIFYNNAEEPELVNYTKIWLKEKYTDSVEYFYTNNNIVLNPYKKGITGSSIPVDTLYTNTGDTLTANNFAFTILYKYGACGGYDGVFKKTIGEEVYDKYIKKQKIKVLRPEYVTVVVNTIKNALLSDKIGNVFKIKI